jgi:hypothetical protein
VKRSLAVLAVLFLLLRPVCDVWAAAHGHAGPAPDLHVAAHANDVGPNQHVEFCCAKAQDGNLIPAVSVGLANAASDGSLFVAAFRSVAGGEVLDRHCVARVPEVPLTRLSYYARSARILR